jgi:hypothetical protein
VSEQHHQQHQRCKSDAGIQRLQQEVDELDVSNVNLLQVEAEALDLRVSGRPSTAISGRQGGAACITSPSPSPSKGAATPTSQGSSGLFNSSDNDRCQRAAGTDDEPCNEPLELFGQGGGWRSASTVLPTYSRFATNVVGKSKGNCRICDSPENQRVFCPTWKNPRRNPAAQPQMQGCAGAPQQRKTAATSGGRKVRAKYESVDSHRPHDSRPAARGLTI